MKQTFEEWWHSTNLGIHSTEESIAKSAWHARDADIAEKDRRIAELKNLVETKRKNYEAMSSSELHLRRRVAALESRIAAALALAEHISEYWNRRENDTAMADALYHMIETADELRAALKEKE